jgi:hypothetical protein
MVGPCRRFAHDGQPEIGRVEPRFKQSQQLQDGIILAIACAIRQRVKRCRPDVALAEPAHVAFRPDRQIDGAVDESEPGAAFLAADLIDHGDERQFAVSTRLKIVAACLEPLRIVCNLRFDALPLRGKPRKLSRIIHPIAGDGGKRRRQRRRMRVIACAGRRHVLRMRRRHGRDDRHQDRRCQPFHGCASTGSCRPRIDLVEACIGTVKRCVRTQSVVNHS